MVGANVWKALEHILTINSKGDALWVMASVEEGC